MPWPSFVSIAVESGHLPTIELVCRHCDVNQAVFRGGPAPLTLAISQGKFAAAQTLLAHRARPNEEALCAFVARFGPMLYTAPRPMTDEAARFVRALVGHADFCCRFLPPALFTHIPPALRFEVVQGVLAHPRAQVKAGDSCCARFSHGHTALPTPPVLGLPLVLCAVEACDVAMVELLLAHGATLDFPSSTHPHSAEFLARAQVAPPLRGTPLGASATTWGNAWHALCRQAQLDADEWLDMAELLSRHLAHARNAVNDEGESALCVLMARHSAHVHKVVSVAHALCFAVSLIALATDDRVRTSPDWTGPRG